MTGLIETINNSTEDGKRMVMPLIEQLVSEINEIFKDKWDKEHPDDWKVMEEEEPDVNKVKKILVRDIDQRGSIIPQCYIYENGAWKYLKDLPNRSVDYSLARYKPIHYDIWKAYSENYTNNVEQKIIDKIMNNSRKGKAIMFV